MKGIDYNKSVFGKIAEIEKKEVELKSEKIELAMDFKPIQKRSESRLKELNKIHNTFLKILPKIEEVKKGYESMKGVAAFEQKELDKYYNQYAKLAKELGIDVKQTQFYKEYLDVQDSISQMEDIIGDLKSRL